MDGNHTRRKLLRASATSGALAGLWPHFTKSVAAKGGGDGQSPRADSQANLFRLLNSGFKESPTLVRIKRVNDGQQIRRYRLESTGTNHPKLQGKSHEERFPHVAADLNSFDNLPPETYLVQVEHEGLVGETTFTIGRHGIPDGGVIHARILPDDHLFVTNTHADSGLRE